MREGNEDPDAHPGAAVRRAGKIGVCRGADAGGEEVREHRWPATCTGHSNSVFVLAFSPDGQTPASGGADRS
ncbi:hypothetical protein [Streptomyces sp. NPDC048187]|uniref:hypothetical protein n=1 Tax=Streptomyces sp. NPDC048187 TaxID=3365509 RepID=UPI0037126FA2